MTPEEMAKEAVVDAARVWRYTVYRDREDTPGAGVWPEERRLAEAVDRLQDKKPS